MSVSRRVFLERTFLGVAAIAVATTVPAVVLKASEQVSVRGILANIEEDVCGLLKHHLFELNDETTRVAAATTVSGYLQALRAQGSIRDYVVVCDASNNPPSVVDAHEFHLTAWVRLTKSLNVPLKYSVYPYRELATT